MSATGTRKRLVVRKVARRFRPAQNREGSLSTGTSPGQVAGCRFHADGAVSVG